MRLIHLFVVCVFATTPVGATPITLIKDGKSNTAIYVAPEYMEMKGHVITASGTSVEDGSSARCSALLTALVDCECTAMTHAS